MPGVNQIISAVGWPFSFKEIKQVGDGLWWLTRSPSTKAKRVLFPASCPPPPRPRFSHVPHDAAGRRVFSGIFRLLPPLHSGTAMYKGEVAGDPRENPHHPARFPLAEIRVAIPPGIEPGSPRWAARNVARIRKFREFNDLYARHHNPLYSRTSNVCSLAVAPVLPRIRRCSIHVLFLCKSAIGVESSRACLIIFDPIAKCRGNGRSPRKPADKGIVRAIATRENPGLTRLRPEPDQNSHGCAVLVRLVFNTTSREHDSALGSPLVDDRAIMNAVKYRGVSGLARTNRTMEPLAPVVNSQLAHESNRADRSARIGYRRPRLRTRAETGEVNLQHVCSALSEPLQRSPKGHFERCMTRGGGGGRAANESVWNAFRFATAYTPPPPSTTRGITSSAAPRAFTALATCNISRFPPGPLRYGRSAMRRRRPPHELVKPLTRHPDGGKREIPENTRRTTASSGTIPTCENPVTRPGIEPRSPWREASSHWSAWCLTHLLETAGPIVVFHCVTAANYCTVDIDKFVHKTVESSLQVIELANFSGLY
ncbi:hypothetical protein PR048_026171 [Dryococelus australis]|uniref:Uncharacterized protein n=1 Tax=Dryococelus australis TaxID=614101 RepID=A0ABQ9GKL3_9NEOP|nr:hypothetical protein PR048_026171 [Dryococelus australis]